MSYLFVVAWVICIIYSTIPLFWLAVHPFADRWRARGKNPIPLLGIIWLSFMVAAGFATYPWHKLKLYDSTWSWLAWLVFFLIAAPIYSRVGEFGQDNLLGRTELEPGREQHLITTGMHSRMRHPIYLAHLCMLTAWTLGSGLAVNFALLALGIAGGFFMVRTEDAELECRFGDAYREYKQKVPAIFPG